MSKRNGRKIVKATALRREVLTGDSLELCKAEAADSFDSCVTDPPYGLSFMGRDWDHGVPGVPFWREFLRVLKPGAHLLAFGGTRTFHRLACAIEDAGFEIRDCIMWVYGSGFPKSLDVGKAIDKAAGAARRVVGRRTDRAATPGRDMRGGRIIGGTAGGVDYGDITAPETELAKQWDGWGTAIKPAWEPIIVARKPLAGTVAANVARYGTGAINVDGCRVPGNVAEMEGRSGASTQSGVYLGNIGIDETWKPNTSGRFPANLIHDGSPEVEAVFARAGERPGMASGGRREGLQTARGSMAGSLGNGGEVRLYGDTGSASRFFYCAKASKADRGEGNDHETVKPTALMRYLVRLVTPPGGTILEPFAGSGSTLRAATAEGFGWVGMEKQPKHASLARRRAFLPPVEDLPERRGKREQASPGQLALFGEQA